MTKKKDKDKQQKSAEAEAKEQSASVEEIVQEKQELFEKLQRVSADYANFQKRAAKQVADSITYEKERILKSMLPVLDNFEHTLQNARAVEDVDVFAKGVRIVYDQMLDVLKSHGVEQIEAVGEKFDPSKHEAMMRREEEDQEDDIVLEEFQKGYRLSERVLRPSKVIVNKLAAADTGKDRGACEGQADEEGETVEPCEAPETEE